MGPTYNVVRFGIATAWDIGHVNGMASFAMKLSTEAYIMSGYGQLLVSMGATYNFCQVSYFATAWEIGHVNGMASFAMKLSTEPYIMSGYGQLLVSLGPTCNVVRFGIALPPGR